MKKAILAALLAAFTLSAQGQDNNTNIAPRLQSLSVTLHMQDGGQCSGSIVTREGQSYILSAGHCVEDERTILQVLDNGITKSIVRFKPVTVTKEIYSDGESVGSTSVEADVIAFSSSDYGQDIAILKVRTPISTESVEFSPDKLVPVGTDLLHVGSIGGQSGSCSFTTGVLSQVGRMYQDKVYDQSTCTAMGGSSGGGMYLRSNGQYVGMLVRGRSDTFNLYVPLRRMLRWAATQHVEFIFDPKAKVDLAAVKLEDREPVSPNGPPAPNSGNR